MNRTKNQPRVRKWVAVISALTCVLAVSGCRTVSYYGQAIRGQYQLLARQHAIKELLASPDLPPRLRERLLLVERLRKFAEDELALPVNGHYLKYADLGRDFAVWNVQAAPEFSVEPKSWWYPIVGRLEYRGYFDKAPAAKYAAGLQKRGFDTYVSGVSAYSTLGWFNDPVLNTFVFDDPAIVAETIFHELAHQRVFARADTDFDEAFATATGHECARRWLRQNATDQALQGYEDYLRRDREFVRIAMAARAKLAEWYGDEQDSQARLKGTAKRKGMPHEELRRGKEQILSELRRCYFRLKQEWGGATDYDAWFDDGINNAKLNSVANYYDLVPGFEALLRLKQRNLEDFFAAVKGLAKMPRAERHQELRELAGQDTQG